MWRDRIRTILKDVRFFDPATAGEIERVERELSVNLPDDLKTVLRESNGVAGQYSAPVVWSAEDIVDQNHEMRHTAAFATLYMRFEDLLFFGADGGGDLFGYRILDGRIVETSWIYRWRHETDSREWFASDMDDYLRRYIRMDD